jgi:hypothetical protein
VIAAHDAVVLHEIEQVRHLLKVRRDVGVVSPQMHVIELYIHDTLDLIAGGMELTGSLRDR